MAEGKITTPSATLCDERHKDPEFVREYEVLEEEFAQAFGISASSIRQYEIGRHMPPPAVRAYLKVIDAEPEVVRRAMAG